MPVVVVVHEPFMYSPSPHWSVHGWQVPSVGARYMAVPHDAHDGVAVALQVPRSCMPDEHSETHGRQALCVPAAGLYVPLAQGVQTGVVVAVHTPLIAWPALHCNMHGAHAVWVPATA